MRWRARERASPSPHARATPSRLRRQRFARTRGAEVLATQSDVSVAADIDSLIERVTGELGPVEILVINTGGPKFGSFDSVSDDDWYEAFALVQLSAIRLDPPRLARDAAQGMGANRRH